MMIAHSFFFLSSPDSKDLSIQKKVNLSGINGRKLKKLNFLWEINEVVEMTTTCHKNEDNKTKPRSSKKEGFFKM